MPSFQVQPISRKYYSPTAWITFPSYTLLHNSLMIEEQTFSNTPIFKNRTLCCISTNLQNNLCCFNQSYFLLRRVFAFRGTTFHVVLGTYLTIKVVVHTIHSRLRNHKTFPFSWQTASCQIAFCMFRVFLFLCRCLHSHAASRPPRWKPDVKAASHRRNWHWSRFCVIHMSILVASK